MILALFLLFVGGILLFFKPENPLERNAEKIVVDDSSFTKVEVLSNNAAVEIVPTNDSVATVEYSGKTKKNLKLLFNADVKGDTLFIQLKEKRRSFFHFGFSSINLKLLVKVPAKQYHSINAETDNGRIQVEGIKVEDIVLETDNGAIYMRNVESTTINVKTDNGKIALDNIDGKITGRTDNGGISLITNNLNRPIELSTDNGRIEIQTDKEPTNATIDAKTDNGKVIIFGQENKQSVFGKGNHLIQLRTDNGRITVTK